MLSVSRTRTLCKTCGIKLQGMRHHTPYFFIFPTSNEDAFCLIHSHVEFPSSGRLQRGWEFALKLLKHAVKVNVSDVTMLLYIDVFEDISCQLKASRFPLERLQQRRLQGPQRPQRPSACPRCEDFWVSTRNQSKQVLG